jgi:hypothetical protein
VTVMLIGPLRSESVAAMGTLFTLICLIPSPFLSSSLDKYMIWPFPLLTLAIASREPSVLVASHATFCVPSGSSAKIL